MRKTVKTSRRVRSGGKTVVGGVSKAAKKGNTTTSTRAKDGLSRLKEIGVKVGKDGQLYWAFKCAGDREAFVKTMEDK